MKKMEIRGENQNNHLKNTVKSHPQGWDFLLLVLTELRKEFGFVLDFGVQVGGYLDARMNRRQYQMTPTKRKTTTER